MEENAEQRSLMPERLIEYEGPKFGKHLRREMKQQVALLYEKVMLLRLVDPSFEKELEDQGALEFLDRYMKRFLLVGAVALSTFAMLAVAAPAWAHVVVSPEEVAAGDYETLTVSVPTEKEAPTTEIRVEVPEGFLLSGVQPVPGWEHAFEEDAGVVTAVTWSGGEIGPREFQQFLVQAQAPEEPGEYPWRAIQTYGDGSVVEWTGPPDAEEPASVVEVVPGGTDGQGSEAREAGSDGEGTVAGAGTDTLAVTGGTSPLVFAVLGVGTLALGALLARRLIRTRNQA